MRAALEVLPEPALPELAELRAIFEMADAPTMRVAIRKLYARLEGRGLCPSCGSVNNTHSTACGARVERPSSNSELKLLLRRYARNAVAYGLEGAENLLLDELDAPAEQQGDARKGGGR